MRAGQKGFGWGKVWDNGATRGWRATTQILRHNDHTLCYQTTLCATMLPLLQLPGALTDRMFAIMATHTASEEGHPHKCG